jgi:TonB family protein
VTFGMRWPVVLLPTRLLDQPPDVQRAVLCHELVHVERRDWAWVLVEEVVRAVFWFHPAIWWVVSRVQLAREEVVDLEAVRMTGGRRTYIQALMAFADSVPLAPVAAFSRRRHLFRRILLISKEKVASPRRLMLSCAAMAAVLVAGSALAVAAFPLSERAVTSNGAGAGRSAAAAAGASRSSAPEPGAPSAAESVARPARADTPRTGLEGVDELTRRLQLRTAPTISPAPVQPVATIAVEETQSARSAAADDSSGPAPVASAGSAAPEDAGAAMRQDPPSVAASPPAAVSPPVRIGGRIAPPQKIKDVKPVYPPIAASAKVSGVVIVEATIGSDGRVNEVRVLRSIPLLDQAAMEAVRQWEFQPTLLNGAPISIVMSMTVNFALQN